MRHPAITYLLIKNQALRFIIFTLVSQRTENLFFVEAVWRMKKLAQKDVAEKCGRIWLHFLAPGVAEMLVNVDST